MENTDKTKKQLTVLHEIQQHGRIAKAAKAAGISRRTVWYWRKQDSAFASADEDSITRFNER